MSNSDNDNLIATWYAFGRQDAQHDPRVDVFDFAAFYVAQRATRGQSVQDAFATYVANLPVACTHPAHERVILPATATGHLGTPAVPHEVCEGCGWDFGPVAP